VCACALFLQEFNEVFGGEHPTMSWHWALPLPVRFPEWAVDNIMGFEYYYDDARCENAGPYREPSETDGENGSDISMSSGMSSSHGDGGGGGVGGVGGRGGRIDDYLGTVEVGSGMGVMDNDVERGTIQHELLLEDEEEIISPPSRLSGGGVKKRSTGVL
jgi:hypothetical protein